MILFPEKINFLCDPLLSKNFYTSVIRILATNNIYFAGWILQLRQHQDGFHGRVHRRRVANKISSGLRCGDQRAAATSAELCGHNRYQSAQHGWMQSSSLRSLKLFKQVYLRLRGVKK